MKTRFRCIIAMFLSVLLLGCDKTSTSPENVPDPIPLDGRGGGVIAYCYQPLQAGLHQLHAVNADGTGGQRLIDASIGLNHCDWSPDGTTIVSVGYMDGGNDTWSIHLVATDGTNLLRLTTTNNVWDNDPSWSPDGSQIAFMRIYPDENNREEIWIMNADGSNQRYIDIEGGSPKWSPDGERLIYHAMRGDNYDIYTCRADGTDEQLLITTVGGDLTPVWSPNGLQIAFTRVGDDLTHHIYVADADGTNLEQLTNSQYGGGAPRWSPDGSMIAFHSGPFEGWEVYIMNADGTNLRQVTQSPNDITAINPVWNPVL